MLSAALAYAAILGRRVLPLEPGGKAPIGRLVPGGSHDASDRDRTIRNWWYEVTDANIGVCADDWCIVDLDTRHDGEAEWIRIVDRRELPRMPAQRTATGGVHLIFQAPAFACRGKLVQGVDVLTGHRYMVAAPSRRPEGEYTWEVSPRTVAPPPLPHWLAELLRRPEPETAPVVHHVAEDDRVRRATAYARTLDPAISGSNGHDATFRAAVLIVRGFALDPAAAYAVLANEFNPRCLPPWSETDLRRKITQALTAGTMPVGALLARAA